jgi:hypothetical protein
MLTLVKTGEDTLRADSSSYLYFVLADARENSNPHPKKEDSAGKNKNNNRNVKNNTEQKETDKEKRKDKETADDEEDKDPYDLTIILTDVKGDTASLPLSHFRHLQRQIEAKLMKADFMYDGPESEIVFQSYFFPLADFAMKNPGLNIMKIQKIQFLFNRTEEGVLVIDNIGYWRKPD